MAQRGVDVSYETIRVWTRKFGRLFAHSLRKSRAIPSARWHLDEMVVRIRGVRMFLWRAVDDEGEVLDMLVQNRRNMAAALKLLRKLLKDQGIYPKQSSPTAWHHTLLRPEKLGTKTAIGLAVCGTTIALRTLIFRSDGANAISSGSNRKVQPRDFSPPMPPSSNHGHGDLGCCDGVRLTMAAARPLASYPR